MNNIIPTLQKTGNWLATILMPVIFVMTAVRLLLTPAYVHVEYRVPWFPEDSYGFTLEDRLEYSIISLEYLLNDEGIEFLENTTFDDGNAIYNEREHQHMVDVKVVTQGALRVWLISLGFVALLGIVQWSNLDDKVAFQVAVRRGSMATLVIIGIIAIIILAAFGPFFVTFHNVFFDPGTWTFAFSDTLIRLFPYQFWQDSFLWISVLTILQALWVISLTKKK
jgi:integral membrane protein (TIGR01906 family)